MAASGSVLELRNSRVRAAALQLEAAVRCIAACVQEAEGPGLGELLILIREAGVDPLEAAFATGVRRFDRSGEYAAEGALGVPPGLNGNASCRGALPPSELKSANSSSACQRPKTRLRGATWSTSTSP